jgi:DNA-binding CsgD family transcriptional regulator
MGADVQFLGGHDFVSGTDRFADPDDIADHLASGAAVVLVGPLGTGKTVTMNRVAQALARRDIPSHLIRGMARVRTALAGPGPEALLAPGTALLVDDAHDLDHESVCVLIEAVCRQRVPVCFTVEAPTVARAPSDPVAAALLGLGTRGFARRIDLEPLAEAEAWSFLLACGADGLDEVTMETVIWLANGSRSLLRELAGVAGDALQDGRDPLAAIREVPPWTRLADAVRSHLSALDTEHLSTLVVVHRFPALSSSHATRIRPVDEVDALRAGGYLHTDESRGGALWANPLLAHGAARLLGSRRVDALVGSAVSRMLEGGGRWWSPPIAVALADLLLRESIRPASAPAHLCRRALRDAARLHNDQGRYASAEAYAAMGVTDGADDVGLRLELAHARVSAGESDTERLLPDVISDEDDQSRAIFLGAVWGLRGHTSMAQALRSALARGSTAGDDPRLMLATVGVLSLSLERREARDAAHDAAAMTTGTSRLWAWLTEAYARGELGDAEGAKRLLGRVDEYVVDGGVPGLSTAERLWVLMVELVTHLVLGEDAPPVHERLARERRRAAREGDDRVLGIAGLAGALSAAVRGDSEEAVRSLEAARTRYPPLRHDMAVASVKLWIAQFLASNGLVRHARDISERVESVWAEGPPALRHACLTTRCMIDALDRRYDEAAPGMSPLTRREREIAHLVVAGMSNREIADHLFISVRTVESHIYQARAKVGARSRRDLGARFVEQEGTA